MLAETTEHHYNGISAAFEDAPNSLAKAVELFYYQNTYVSPITANDLVRLRPLQGLPTWLIYGLLDYSKTGDQSAVNADLALELFSELTTVGAQTRTADALLYYMWLRVGPKMSNNNTDPESSSEPVPLENEAVMVWDTELDKNPDHRPTTRWDERYHAVPPEKKPLLIRRRHSRGVIISQCREQMNEEIKKKQSKGCHIRPLIEPWDPIHNCGQLPLISRLPEGNTDKTQYSRRLNAAILIFVSALVFMIGAAIPWVLVKSGCLLRPLLDRWCI